MSCATQIAGMGCEPHAGVQLIHRIGQALIEAVRPDYKSSNADIVLLNTIDHLQCFVAAGLRMFEDERAASLAVIETSMQLGFMAYNFQDWIKCVGLLRPAVNSLFAILETADGDHGGIVSEDWAIEYLASALCRLYRLQEAKDVLDRAIRFRIQRSGSEVCKSSSLAIARPVVDLLLFMYEIDFAQGRYHEAESLIDAAMNRELRIINANREAVVDMDMRDAPIHLANAEVKQVVGDHEQLEWLDDMVGELIQEKHVTPGTESDERNLHFFDTSYATREARRLLAKGKIKQAEAWSRAGVKLSRFRASETPLYLYAWSCKHREIEPLQELVALLERKGGKEALWEAEVIRAQIQDAKLAQEALRVEALRDVTKELRGKRTSREVTPGDTRSLSSTCVGEHEGTVGLEKDKSGALSGESFDTGPEVPAGAAGGGGCGEGNGGDGDDEVGGGGGGGGDGGDGRRRRRRRRRSTTAGDAKEGGAPPYTDADTDTHHTDEEEKEQDVSAPDTDNDASEMCSLCLDEMITDATDTNPDIEQTDTTASVCVQACGHRHHDKCLDYLVSFSVSKGVHEVQCPLCRQPLVRVGQ